jgi:hypothetical protein
VLSYFCAEEEDAAGTAVGCSRLINEATTAVLIDRDGTHVTRRHCGTLSAPWRNT